MATYKARTQTTAKMWRAGVSEKVEAVFHPDDITYFDRFDKKACSERDVFEYSKLRWFNTCSHYIDGGVKNDSEVLQEAYVKSKEVSVVSIGKRIYETIGG